MPVSDQHKDYAANLPKWQLVRDCVEGSAAIKRRGGGVDGGSRNSGRRSALAGTRYLPQPNPTDNSTENIERYEQYRTRANFVNFTGHTEDGFLGMVYRRAPEVELADNIKFLEENADGMGLSLLQMLQGTTADVMETGRHGLLVDFPPSSGGTDAQTADLQPKIVQYEAEAGLNWRTAVVIRHKQLVLVVLREPVEIIDEDGFSVKCETYRRVLSFNKDGNYIQRLYDQDDKLLQVPGGAEGQTDIMPTQADGKPWKVIPFVFVGSKDNSPSPDKAPLYDLAEVNISHYRNSADFEESSFMVGQPTPVLAGLTQSWVDTVLKGKLLLGSRAMVLLPANASATLLQANPNQMPGKGMEEKEKQMVKIGAKIITDSTGVETAEAAKLRFAGQNSKLSMVLNNVERAFLQCFEWAGLFMKGGAGENILKINREFYQATVDPQLLVANMQLMDRGVIAKTDVRNILRKSSLIDVDRTDEDIDNEVGDVDPLA